MEIETNIDEDKGIEMMDSEEEENVETDGEVDLEEELMCALREIKKLRKKNLKQKEQLQKYEEEDRDSKSKMSQSLEEIENTIMNLKVQLEEARRMEEVVRIQLKKKEENCEELESEIVSLRKELEKTTIKLNRSLKFEKSIEILDDIINCQRSPFIKTGLGYDVVVSSLPTPGLATTREVLFVAGGVQTSFPEEKPTVDCAKQIDELHVPHME
jgi:predicted RNase H-like nuclease (RuvC/YqgF family)